MPNLLYRDRFTLIGALKCFISYDNKISAYIQAFAYPLAQAISHTKYLTRDDFPSASHLDDLDSGM